MKYFLKYLFLFIAQGLLAQFKWVQVGVDGLTCSMCSKSVEMSIRKLDFVDNVEMNLEHTEGKITFKSGAQVNVEKIAQAVVNAGFSVRYLHAGFVFDNLNIGNGNCFAFDGKQFQFIKAEPKTLNGEATLKFIGKKFQSPKEYKHWKGDMKPACDKTKGEIYYVTI